MNAYRYGTFLDVELDQVATDVENLDFERFTVERYGLYLGISVVEITFSNDLTLDKSPETHLTLGEGIVAQWSGVQPLEGGKAYAGQFSDLTKEGSGGIELSADWSLIALRLGANTEEGGICDRPGV